MPGGKPPVPTLKAFLVSAEHASRRVPARWQSLFADHGATLGAILDSHRAWDPGSAALARDLAAALDAPLLAGRVSRLLVDLNRSASHPHRFSEFSLELPAAEREYLARNYWAPHWQAFGEALETLPRPLLHIGCHSFTPELDGDVRDFEIGLLYDPSRPAERAFCDRLAGALAEHAPDLKVRRNRPYRGAANGIGQQHRRGRADGDFASVELEVNQRLVAASRWPQIRRMLVAAVAEAAGLNRPGRTPPRPAAGLRR